MDVANNFQNVTHCVFDMDGLLLDTEKLYTQATQNILDKYGKTYTWEVKAAIMGFNHRTVSEKIVAAYDLPISWEEYARLQNEATHKMMIDAELMPDTEVIYEEIEGEIARIYNKSYSHEVHVKMLGTTDRKSAEIAIEELQLPITVDEYLKVFDRLSRERLGNAPVLKGVERLLRHLSAHNIPIAVATSSAADLFDIKTTHHRELFNLFHHCVCGSDPEVKESKPAPDIFLVAASRFEDKPDPSKCLVFEDAPNGVRAAVSAGMQVVLIPDEHVPAEMYGSPTQVLKSMEDFKPEQFGLPAFEP